MNLPSLERWNVLWRAAGASGDPLPWFNQLAAAYSEPRRHYHNLRHIAECLGELDAVRHLARQPNAVELALWFHDAVYDPKAPDNEEQSSALAARCLAEVRIGAAFAQRVGRLVLATKQHDASLDPDAPVMVDVDLSILGQSEERFREYETQIRLEYAWVPENVFAHKRAEILERFLARPQLYTTAWFYGKYEKQARSNLLMSLRILRSLSP